jgi:hypothetical protein
VKAVVPRLSRDPTEAKVIWIEISGATRDPFG